MIKRKPGDWREVVCQRWTGKTLEEAGEVGSTDCVAVEELKAVDRTRHAEYAWRI